MQFVLIKKKDIPTIDFSNLTTVGIDDFAIKKRHTYGTIMINHQNKKIVDMIPSRDTSDLNLWFKNLINLSSISRDGSLTYKNAIDISFKKINQISDRFHLIKSLSEAVCNEIKTNYNKVLVGTKEFSYKEKISILERYNKCKKDIETGINISNACINNKIYINLFKKIDKMTDNDKNQYFAKKDKLDIKIEENQKRKKDLIKQVRDSYSSCKSISKVSKIFDIDRKTIKNYLNDDYVSNLFSDDKTKGTKSKLLDYENIILEGLNNSESQKNIFLKLKDAGYDGTYSNLRMYIRKIKKKGKLTVDIFVEKRDILNLLFHKRNNELFPKEYLNIAFNKYPKIKKVITIFHEFKSILLKIKNKKYLEKWIIKANNLNSQYLNSFIKGLQRDYDAVINALLFKESNGIVESKVNTTKLSKRIMYGRSSFNLIKNKTLRLQSLRQ